MVIEEFMSLSTYMFFGVLLIGVGFVSFNTGVGVGRRSIPRAGAESVSVIGSHVYGWNELRNTANLKCGSWWIERFRGFWK